MTSDILVAAANAAQRPRPKLILPIGSDRTGKTFWSRWLIDRAAQTVSPLLIIEGDTINPGLAPHYAAALIAPPFPDDQPAWLEQTLDTAVITTRRSALLDLGQQLFGLTHWLAEVPLKEALEENGVDLVAVCLLTPDPYSHPRLPYLLELIRPTRTLIVLNEWGFDGPKARAAFAPILADPIVDAQRAAGARIVAMPHLEEADALDAIRAHARTGASGATKEHPAVSAWLTQMDHNFAPVADWLD